MHRHMHTIVCHKVKLIIERNGPDSNRLVCTDTYMLLL